MFGGGAAATQALMPTRPSCRASSSTPEGWVLFAAAGGGDQRLAEHDGEGGEAQQPADKCGAADTEAGQQDAADERPGGDADVDRGGRAGGRQVGVAWRDLEHPAGQGGGQGGEGQP